MAMQDQDLVRRAQQGSLEARAELWTRSRGFLTAVLVAHGPRGEELDDLLQEVALRIFDALSELRDPRACRSWMRRIALHVAASSGRRRRLEQSTRQELEARVRNGQLRNGELHEGPLHNGQGGAAQTPNAVVPTPSTAWTLAQREELDRVLHELERLPLELREVLALRAVDSLRATEIADILDLPRTTIETRLARARRELRRRLAVSSGHAMPPTHEKLK